MSLDDQRDHLIAKAISMINEDIALPIDLLAELDELGVNINWLFLEAASMTPSIYNIE